jgi:hypothetical protein
LPIGLTDLGLVEADEAIEALVGSLGGDPQDPLANPVTGPRGRVPTNLSGGLKARGHPVGGTGLFQICECFLQLVERFPVREAQVPGARLGVAQSIGGPGNNNYVTLLESSDTRRRRDEVRPPRMQFESRRQRPAREAPSRLHDAQAVVVAATAIHVTAGGGPPLHVALVECDGRRLFARLDPEQEASVSDQELAGQKVRLRITSDGDPTFVLGAQRQGFGLGRFVESLRRRVGAGGD